MAIEYFKRNITLQIVTALCLFFSLSLANAQTVNHTAMEGADISIFFSNEEINNEPQWRYGLIDVSLHPNWKTYWKNSGSSGLSPQLQIENGINSELLFPVPHLSQQGRDWAYIYKQRAQIVFRIATTDVSTDTIKGNLLIGICDTICVPVDVPFIFNSKSANNFVSQLKVKAALNALPKKADRNFYAEKLQILDKSIQLTLHVPNNNENTEIFLAAENAQIGVAKPISEELGKIVFSAPILSGKIANEQKIDFIAKNGNDAISGSLNTDR
ncbi:protein-disulfide reductase DsbD family protein [Bartonella sp. HY329]|uniref:protein-disulfide reductase DsbD domain-containing protein n=1 Tax=unclassified Bartonella TaxID=2645622 RepID=UPI0021C5723E|nr:MULTISPECIES: protein-disulfide reductase DsbD domain-containing protein [unclassified Bartonella]UXM93972.1 protein-disulfide reductase DsbD family protein [Bartonella sp. HY329]UXN08293.1 protein-disulfide reductase DsbD family protein [Bartonella sp. HY328]